MEIFLISVGLIAIAFSGIAIKLIFKKNGEFSGTCASQSPFLNKSDEPLVEDTSNLTLELEKFNIDKKVKN